MNIPTRKKNFIEFYRVSKQIQQKLFYYRRKKSNLMSSFCAFSRRVFFSRKLEGCWYRVFRISFVAQNIGLISIRVKRLIIQEIYSPRSYPILKSKTVLHMLNFKRGVSIIFEILSRRLREHGHLNVERRNIFYNIHAIVVYVNISH